MNNENFGAQPTRKMYARFSMLRSRLGRKLLWWFIVLSIAPLVVTGYLGYDSSAKSLSRMAHEKLEDAVGLRIDFMRELVHRFEQDVQFLANNQSTRHALTQFGQLRDSAGGSLRSFVKSFEWTMVVQDSTQDLTTFRENRGYSDVLLLNMSGEVVYSAAGSRYLGQDLTSGVFKNSRMHAALREAQRTGRVVFSDFQMNPLSEQVDGFMLELVTDEFGNSLGFAGFPLPYKLLVSVLQRQQIGLTGEAYLVGQDLKLRTPLARANEADVLQLMVDNALTRAWSNDVKNHKATADEPVAAYIDHAGREVLGGYGNVRVGDKDLALLVEMRTQEVYAPVVALRNLVILLALGTLAVVVLVVWWVARSISKPLSDSIKDMSASTAHIESTVAEQASSGHEQLASVDQIANSVERLAASAVSNSDQVGAVSEETRQGLQMAEHGGENIAKASLQMGETETKMQAVVEHVGMLSQQLKDINKINAAMIGFANQTNMLAVNASIQAAQDKQKDTGFGVIATEIRRLSLETKASAAEVRKVVDAVQTSMSSTLSTVNEGTSTLTESVRLIEEVAEIFNQMVDSYAQSVKRLEEVAHVVQDESNRITETRDAMGEINRAQAENLKGVDLIRASVSDLNQVAQRLKSIV